MKKYIFLILATIISSQLVYAEISSFSFTTKPQIILPGVLSDKIIIQSQGVNGLSEPVTETFDLEFTSTSPTGLFLGSTGKPVSKVMAKGTANRTFYYEDSSLGDFIVTIKATGRESKRSSIATQPIIISEQIRKMEVPKIIKNQKNLSEIATTTISTSTIEVFIAPKHLGFVNTVFAWPIKVFGFIKHLFVEG